MHRRRLPVARLRRARRGRFGPRARPRSAPHSARAGRRRAQAADCVRRRVHRPRAASERAFERRLWTQLQRLHEHDDPDGRLGSGGQRRPRRSACSPSASAAARYFVVGLHPQQLADRAALSRGPRWYSIRTRSSSDCAARGGSSGLRDAHPRARDRAAGNAQSQPRGLRRAVGGAAVFRTRRSSDGWRCPFHRAQRREDRGDDGRDQLHLEPQTGTALAIVKRGQLLKIIDPARRAGVRPRCRSRATTRASGSRRAARSTTRTRSTSPPGTRSTRIAAGRCGRSSRTPSAATISCSRRAAPTRSRIIYEHHGPSSELLRESRDGARAVRHRARRDPDDAQHLHERRGAADRASCASCRRARAPAITSLLRAEMDMIVGVTACSAELSNNGTLQADRRGAVGDRTHRRLHRTRRVAPPQHAHRRSGVAEDASRDRARRRASTRAPSASQLQIARSATQSRREERRARAGRRASPPARRRPSSAASTIATTPIAIATPVPGDARARRTSGSTAS